MLDERHEAWHGVADQDIKQRVRSNRKHRSAENAKFIEQEHAGKMKDSNHWFMNANLTIADRQSHKLKRFAAYGNPESMCLLKGKMRSHVDAAFKVCPKNYEQMLVAMVFDIQLDTYVDVLHMLVSGEIIFLLHFLFKS